MLVGRHDITTRYVKDAVVEVASSVWPKAIEPSYPCVIVHVAILVEDVYVTEMRSSSFPAGDKLMLSLICIVGWPTAGNVDRTSWDGHGHEDAQTRVSQVNFVRRVFASYNGTTVSDEQQRILKISRMFKKPANSPLLLGLSEPYLQPVTAGT
jgi:hypothetical protein